MPDTKKTIQIAGGQTAILIFDLDTNREEFELAQKAGAMASALFEVRQDLFRPARKHGYQDTRLLELEKENPGFEEIIGRLEELYTEILIEHDILGVT